MAISFQEPRSSPQRDCHAALAMTDCRRGLHVPTTPADGAAPFDDDGIAPDSVEHRNPLATTHNAKPASQVYGNAGLVFRNNTALQGPVTAGFRGGHQRRQQPFADAAPTHRCVHIDAVLCDAGVASASRYRRQRGPGNHGIAQAGHEAAVCQVSPVPAVPVGRFSLKSRVAGWRCHPRK